MKNVCRKRTQRKLIQYDQLFENRYCLSKCYNLLTNDITNDRVLKYAHRLSKFVSNFTMMIWSYRSANRISKCFVRDTHYIPKCFPTSKIQITL